MKIAVVTSTVGGQIDQVLSEVAAKLEADGQRLSGVVKVLEIERETDHYCDMDVRVLPNGPQIRITQSLGEGSEGCRLDPGAIVEAVAQTARTDISHADMFILNKFGPQEAEGRGFCDSIASALEHDKPVLVGVAGSKHEAFNTFVDGLAEALPAETDTIYNWCKAAIKQS